MNRLLEKYKEKTKDCSECNVYKKYVKEWNYQNLYLNFCHEHREQYGKKIDKSYITMREIHLRFEKVK